MVYFLFDDRRLIYIGHTRRFLQRIDTHKEDKDFTHVSYITVPKHLYDLIEAMYIAKYKPELNISAFDSYVAFDHCMSVVVRSL